MNKYNLIDTFFTDQEDYIKFLVELKELTIGNKEGTCTATLKETDKGILYTLNWLKDGKYIGNYIKRFPATRRNITTFNEGCKILAERLEVFIDTDDASKIPDDFPAFRELTLLLPREPAENDVTILLSKIERCKTITQNFIDSYFEKASESAWGLEPKKKWAKLFPAKYKKQYKKTLREDIDSIFQQKIPQGKINFATLWKMYGLSDENLEKSKLAKYSIKWLNEKELLMKQWFDILYENIDAVDFEILKNNSKEMFSQQIKKFYDSGIRITAFYNIEDIIDTIDGRYPNLYNLHIDEQDDVLTKTGEKKEAQRAEIMAKKELKMGTEEDIRKMHEQMKKEDYWEKRKEEGKKNYQKYAPFFENLYENKIVYHERITRIVRLEDLEVTEEGFRAKAIQEKVILSKFQQERCQKLNTLEKVRNSPCQWTFSGTWEGAIISEKPLSIAMPYVSFVLWLEPNLVKYIEKLAEYGDDEDALKILWNN